MKIKKMDLPAIIASHGKWLRGEVGGSHANLSNADLSNADLSNADLSRAYLSNADLSNAYLSRADLSNADLSRAYLSNADLSNADLSRANLSNAYLSRANLSNADLSNAYLSHADLSHANLSNADLSNAYLSHANLSGVIALPAFSHCPDVGAFNAWKKLNHGLVAQLTIPSEAARTSSLVGRKCRAEFAFVVAITNSNGAQFDTGTAKHDGTVYMAGSIVRPDRYDPDIRVECTHGIHFFITRKEAEDY